MPSFLRILARRNMTGVHYAHRRGAGQQQGRHYSDFRPQTARKCLNARHRPPRRGQNRDRIREVGLEHGLLWQYRHKGKSGAKEEDTALASIRTTLSDRILAFRDLVNADRNFVIYKTLVGFESVFPIEWESDALNVEVREAFRNDPIRDLVNEVTENTADEWLSILARCARTELKDGATFISFDRFLQVLGKSKPATLMSYLDRLDDRLANFYPLCSAGWSLGREGSRFTGGFWGGSVIIATWGRSSGTSALPQ